MYGTFFVCVFVLKAWQTSDYNIPFETKQKKKRRIFWQNKKPISKIDKNHQTAEATLWFSGNSFSTLILVSIQLICQQIQNF